MVINKTKNPTVKCTQNLVKLGPFTPLSIWLTFLLSSYICFQPFMRQPKKTNRFLLSGNKTIFLHSLILNSVFDHLMKLLKPQKCIWNTFLRLKFDFLLTLLFKSIKFTKYIPNGPQEYYFMSKNIMTWA